MAASYSVEETYYLSEEGNIDRLLEETSLSLDEVESMVGYFTKTSQWHGKLRGEVVKYFDGRIVLRHHFKKSLIYWRDTI